MKDYRHNVKEDAQWKEVEERQEQSMVKAFNAMWEVKEQYDVTPREATYMYAIKQIAEAMKLRGWY